MINQKVVIDLSLKGKKSITGTIYVNNFYRFNFKLKKSTNEAMFLTVKRDGGNDIAIWAFPKYYQWNKDIDNQRVFKWLAANSKKLMAVVSPRA